MDLRTPIIPLYSTNRLVFITQRECLRCLPKGKTGEAREMREQWIEYTGTDTLRFLCSVQCLEDGTAKANFCQLFGLRMSGYCPSVVIVIIITLIIIIIIIIRVPQTHI